MHSADLGADKWFERRRSAGWDSGEHYPSDVIAGALLGTLWLACVLRTLPGDLAPGTRTGRAADSRGRRRVASAIRS